MNKIKKNWNGINETQNEIKRRRRKIKRIIIKIMINVNEWRIKKIRNEKNLKNLR